MSEEIRIPASLAGERIDRVVALLSGRSRGEVAALIGTDAIRLGGRPVASKNRKVAEGDLIELDLPEHVQRVARPDVSGAVVFGVVYEDEDLVVVDKPAGLVVHPGAGHRDDTLVSGLLSRYPDLRALLGTGLFDEERPGIVHRLDKDTSGLLAIARSALAFESLSAQLAERSMARTYRCLALGEVAANEGTIDAPLGRSTRDPTRVAVRSDGRPARTHYRVLERHGEPVACSSLELSLETGRTHQIRVHLAAIGHPVAGDRRYGGTARALGLERPFLHASRLALEHPRTGERVVFESPLPPDLEAVRASLS